MLLNGKEYDQHQIKEMTRLYDRCLSAKSRKRGEYDQVNQRWPKGSYRITYSDGTTEVSTLKGGDYFPSEKERKLVIHLPEKQKV